MAAGEPEAGPPKPKKVEKVLTPEEQQAQEEEREKKRTERFAKKAIKVKKKCATRPLILKGWIIEVEEFGKGEVVDFKSGGAGMLQHVLLLRC